MTNNIFDPVKYATYSPVFIPTTFALAYGTAFATFPAVFMHTSFFLYIGSYFL